MLLCLLPVVAFDRSNPKRRALFIYFLPLPAAVFPVQRMKPSTLVPLRRCVSCRRGLPGFSCFFFPASFLHGFFQWTVAAMLTNACDVSFSCQGKNGIPLLARRKARDVELMMNDDSWLK